MKRIQANLARSLGVAAICGLLLAGCKGKEFQLNNSQEMRIGTAAIRTLSFKNAPSAENARRVSRVGLSLALVKEKKRKLLYSFHALNLPQKAAISLPGGPVAVSEGALAQLTDDQLLALLAHEMGHIENNDFAALYHRRKDAMMVTGYLTGGLSLLKLATDEKLVREWAITPNWSPEEEMKADQTAMELLTKAGKSPALLTDLLAQPPLEELRPTPARLKHAQDLLAKSE